MTKKIFSFFSGAGFLDLGFETEAFTVAFVNEFHSPFLNAYKYSRTQMSIEEPEYGYFSKSITELIEGHESERLSSLLNDCRNKGDLVGFVGGPPCPDFSVGGKNRGRHGDNGKLSQVYADLICKQSPDFFLFENVKGLWKTKRHREFYEELKRQFIEAGFVLFEKLINALEFGVPQDRERIILLGFHKRLFTQDIISDTKQISEGVFFPWVLPPQFNNKSVFSYPWPTVSPFVENGELVPPIGIPVELTVEHWFKANAVESHPNSEHCFKPKAGLTRFQTIDEGDDKKKSFKRLHRWRYSPTAAYGHNEVHLHPYKARRITAAEALAIQSLPEKFVLPSDMTLSDMFKTIGNGVPYLAAKSIAHSISIFLRNPHAAITHGVRYSQSYREAFTQKQLQLY